MAYHTIIIKNCNFRNNTSWTISINNGIGHIEDCIIKDGYTRIDSSNYFSIKRNNIIGGGLSLNSSRGTIERNTIYNSPGGYVISINNSNSNQLGDNVRIINNLIFNNSGIGIKCQSSLKIKIINNTIVNNESGIQFFSSTNCEIINNIIRKAPNSTYLSLYVSSLDSSIIIENNNIKGRYIFESNIIDGDSGAGNIDFDPQFINPILASGPAAIIPNYDWSLLPSSKCINAGLTDTTGLNVGSLDLASNDRIYGSTIDMGAFESKTISPSQGNICNGDSLLLYTIALDTTPSTYQWNLNGIPLLGENNDTLSVNPFTTINKGVYSCDIHYSNDTVLGNYSEVNIDTIQPIILSQNTLLGNAVVGDSVVLYVETMNAETYQWHRDSVLISDESDSLLIFESLFSIDTGHVYYCVVSNGCGLIQTQNPIGIQSYDTSKKIKIYPNPTTNQLTIVSEKLFFNKVDIINITGKTVQSKKLNTSSINVSDLPQGIYFIKLFSEEKVFIKKFIKQ
ncbi:MAG: T9SS type A sorting domain-containing protein [Flavobacteriales bacterium]|nr:T9SS type A sorting domain-containing protein [Flavobacteriales bacterium]